VRVSEGLLANGHAAAQHPLRVVEFILMLAHETELVQHAGHARSIFSIQLDAQAQRFTQQALGTVEMAEVKLRGADGLEELRAGRGLIVQIVRDHTSYERGIVEDVSAARERAVSAGGVAETAKAERELTEGVGKLLAVAEAYPDLKASQSFVTFQVQLADLETRIAVARQVYNDTVQTYNEMVQTLPTALVARSMGFETRAFFDITPTERVAPPVAV